MDSDAAHTLAAFMRAMEDAQAMADVGNVGAELDDLLEHAKELLDIMDEELVRLDREKHRHVFDVASSLRGELERLRDELRGGVAH